MLQNKKCCIDSSVWVKYAGHFKIATLFNCINTNSLVVFADNYLLSEIHEALVTGFDFSFSEADKAIHLVESISLITAPRNVYRFSPDQRTIIYMISVFRTIVCTSLQMTKNC